MDGGLPAVQNSKVTLIYECCADLGITDRVGDLIQKKLHGIQAAQVAPQLQGQSLAMASPRTKKPSLLDPKVVDEGFICGSSAFQELAGYSSSYEGQLSRDSFHRKNRFEAEEAKLRDQFDIFGNPKKLPSPKSQQDAGAITRSVVCLTSVLTAFYCWRCSISRTRLLATDPAT